MSTILAESPVMLSIMIGVIAVALLYGWMQSGNRNFGIAGLFTLLLIPVAIYVTSILVTDREQILDVIERTAVAVQANDHQTAAEVISDPETKARALAELPKFTFERARARNIQIRMVDGSDPPEATVDLDAAVTASMARGGMKNVPVVRRLILTFQKQSDDQWRVIDYSHQPPIGGPDGYSNR